MASPDHAAGLAVVVPPNDNRSQPRGKVKQNAFNSPRKPPPQLNVIFPPRLSNGTSPTPPCLNGIPPYSPPKTMSPWHLQNGAPFQQTNGGSHSQTKVASPPPIKTMGNHNAVKAAIPNQQRLLGVDEALQFSPFSSIVPFSSDIIPIPNANLPGSQPIFSTPEEKCSARQSLEYLNSEVSRTNGQSTLAQRARHDLKPYLDQEGVTDFNFKPIRGLNSGRERRSPIQNESCRSKPPNIGAFANMMLQATDLTNRYPTPTSPEHTSVPRESKTNIAPHRRASQLNGHRSIAKHEPSPTVLISTKTAVRPETPVTPAVQRNINNDRTSTENVNLSAKPHLLSPTQTKPSPMVVIPPLSAEARRSDFVTYEEPSSTAKVEPSRKRKRESDTQAGASLSQTRDQKAASDEIVLQLQELVQEILEADDQSQSDGSGQSSSFNTQFFLMINHDGRDVLTLTPAVHVKLESLLLKVTNIGRLGDLPVEHLARLQSLSEGALVSAESSDLRIEPEWCQEDFTSWISRLDGMDFALRSARTILRIMTGGREEKQLYSEELLQSLLAIVKKTLTECLTPLVRFRSSGPTSAVFEAACSHRNVISQLLSDINKIMTLLRKLMTSVEVAEMVVTGIEFFAIPLLFMENSIHEKDSVIGLQKLESLRRVAMDLITTIFTRYSAQRLFIFDEILTSLQRLPVSEKHARQYKLTGGKNIMLVSALIMQLVQTSAAQSATTRTASRRALPPSSRRQKSNLEDSDDDEHASAGAVEDDEESDQSDDADRRIHQNPLQRLSKESTYLIDNAAKSAQYIVRFLVQRASTASKTGESPHRLHLDMFVQDFITVLGLPEWPAAELLLRMLYASCRNIAVENPKSLAPAKNMALELLGWMGSAISELVSSARQTAKTLENQESESSGFLRQMLDDYLDGNLESSEVFMLDGPYRMVAEYLQSNCSDGPPYDSALAYYLAQWAKAASSGHLQTDSKADDLALKLGDMVAKGSCDVANDSPVILVTHVRIAYALTLLTTDFCRQSDYILRILLDSISSEQITIRTRSLKSVDKILEGDPSVLDRAKNVKILITNCATDASPMVRDSALTLIGKCISLKPALEQEFLRPILRMTDDPAAGVRKRSIKMLKEVYLRNADKNVKTAICDSLLQRAKDIDTGVSELTRQTLEDVWLSPFGAYPDLTEATVQNKVDLRNQISLMVGTVNRGEKVAVVLIHFLKEALSPKAKNATANFKVCKLLVAAAFDVIIDNFQDAERLEQRHILQTLTILATASPRLFNTDQLQSLQPYIANLSGKDDLEVFRSIVIIFRHVLPVLSNVQHGLLRDIQKALMQSISKLGKLELNEVANCLWTINSTLQNPDALLRLTISVIKNLHNLVLSTFANPNQADDLKRVKKYIQIAGNFGKHCDFESHKDVFQNSFKWWKGSSVAGLLIESIIPFTANSQPLSLRAEAFDSIGLICQSWPYQFTQERVSKTFQDVLHQCEAELQTIVLSNFREFFARIDRQGELKAESIGEGATAPSGEKLGGSMTATDGDGAAALIAQRFLKDILNIALASQNASALSATEVIASINRQGLVHPKESGPALVALETSTNASIAEVAVQEHRLLHQQHESMFEREYMRAIQEAFRYQKDVAGDTLGFTTKPYTAKLHAMFDIIKTSKGKYQKKFLSNFCAKTNFDVTKMDLSGSPPRVLQFSRFLVENLAFFDYGRSDELMHAISCMEKVVADTGSGIAHSISTEIFNVTVESMPEANLESSSQNPSQEQGPSRQAPPPVDASRLHQLTAASIILSIVWESRTYLRRLYGLSSSQQRREGKGKAAVKDLNKAPSRIQGINGDKFVTTIADKVDSLKDEESMVQQCREFVDLLSVDNEVKVAAEGDEEADQPETPSDEEDRDTPTSGGSKGTKRKTSVSMNGTPTKKRRGRPSLKRKQSGKSVDSDEDWD